MGEGRRRPQENDGRNDGVRGWGNEGLRVGEKEEHGEQQRARAPQALLWAGNTSALAATTGLPQAEAGAVCAHGALGGMGNVTNRFMK